MESTELCDNSRNVIIRADGEQIGLLADNISDVVFARIKDIEPAPANINGIDSRFFQGIYKLESDLLVILDVNEIINNEDNE